MQGSGERESVAIKAQKQTKSTIVLNAFFCFMAAGYQSRGELLPLVMTKARTESNGTEEVLGADNQPG